MSAAPTGSEPVPRAPEPLGAAVARVRAGGLVAFPTETVWGLGADARSALALERLRRWKGRDAGQPVAVLVADLDACLGLGLAVGGAARRLAAAFWPGPLTLVLPALPGTARVPSDPGTEPRRRLATGVARADGAVGVRCSPHPVARALARALAATGAGPLTATSLNRHGAPPARTRAEAEAACGSGDEAPLVIGGVPGPGRGLACDAGGTDPSTVVDLTGPRVVVLRAGAIAADALAAALGEEVAAP